MMCKFHNFEITRCILTVHNMFTGINRKFCASIMNEYDEFPVGEDEK